MKEIIKQFLESGSIIEVGKGRVVIGFDNRTWSAAPINADLPQFYFPDFFLAAPKPWFHHERYLDIAIEELIVALKTISIDHEQTHFEWTTPPQPLFQETFIDLKKRFSAKELLKAVPFVFETTRQSMTRSILVRSLISLLTHSLNMSIHLYGFWENESGILGGTPELLFCYHKKESLQLETMACAGTRSVSDKDKIPVLLQDPKELHEHQVVVDGIMESLEPLGKVFPGKIGVLEFPKLMHLVTPITAELNAETSFDTIVRALHPTPALGAFPKQAGRKWLQDYQTKIDRRRFGAPAGYLNSKGTGGSCLVAIRNMQWDAKGIILGAGCGVVPESDMEREWQEIKAKIQAIKHILAL